MRLWHIFHHIVIIPFNAKRTEMMRKIGSTSEINQQYIYSYSNNYFKSIEFRISNRIIHILKFTPTLMLPLIYFLKTFHTYLPTYVFIQAYMHIRNARAALSHFIEFFLSWMLSDFITTHQCIFKVFLYVSKSKWFLIDWP